MTIKKFIRHDFSFFVCFLRHERGGGGLKNFKKTKRKPPVNKY